ncbi:hypothetical protein RAS1_35130 [Phycisphaerae bacterium RAS1]|nr:hypothetical protein RAS1_35130 [Phycisphaerae bacterium RAS1]
MTGEFRAIRGVLVAATMLSACAGCLPPLSAGPSVWIVDGREDASGDVQPSFENSIYSATRGEIRLAAAVNETVAFQIAISSTTTGEAPLELTFSDLVGDGGRLSAASAIHAYRVQSVRVRRFPAWYPQHTGRAAWPASFPDILVPWNSPRGGGPIRLGSGQRELVWIDVCAPPTTPPGEYSASVELRGDAAVFRGLLKLRVLPIALPGEPSLTVVTRVDPRDLLSAHLRWPLEPAEQTRLLPSAPSHQAAIQLVSASMRLLHEHRMSPVLWAAFPKYRPTGDRQVEIAWEEYDALVSGFVDGRAYADRARPGLWPIPASINYPPAAANGGIEAPRYAALLGSYLAECRRHFADRGWLEQAVFRPLPPGAVSTAAVGRMARLGAIVRQSEADVPILAHLPPASLRVLGDQSSPAIDLPDVDLWAMRGMWFQPEVVRQQQQLGKQAWLLPDQPPYSPSLSVAGLPVDAEALGWLAWRYGLDGLWIEDAAEFGGGGWKPENEANAESSALIYPGEPFGLFDQPVPSIRLKRLRSAVQAYELLRLLDRAGKELMARTLAEQAVSWAGTDACVDHLLHTREAGWPADASALALARELVVQELTSTFGGDSADSRQISNLTRWALTMNRAQRVRAEVRGVRLQSGGGGEMRAVAFCDVTNLTSRLISGKWTLPSPPLGWRMLREPVVSVPAGGRRATAVEFSLAGLSANIDGVFDVELVFEADGGSGAGLFPAPARLALALCPRSGAAPRIDGDLADWGLASSNAAGDFRLVRGRRGAALAGRGAPTRASRAFFSMDADSLHVAVRCELAAGEKPVWSASNTVPIDGAIPWGQDVVEILLCPRAAAQGSSSEIYCLQVKPSGLLCARRGCRTEPPIGASEPWLCNATVAVTVQPTVWTVELSLPLSALDGSAWSTRVWGCNVTRLDAARGEYSSWSGAQGDCYRPELLGNLVVSPP